MTKATGVYGAARVERDHDARRCSSRRRRWRVRTTQGQRAQGTSSRLRRRISPFRRRGQRQRAAASWAAARCLRLNPRARRRHKVFEPTKAVARRTTQGRCRAPAAAFAAASHPFDAGASRAAASWAAARCLRLCARERCSRRASHISDKPHTRLRRRAPGAARKTEARAAALESQDARVRPHYGPATPLATKANMPAVGWPTAGDKRRATLASPRCARLVRPNRDGEAVRLGLSISHRAGENSGAGTAVVEVARGMRAQ